MVSAQVKTAQVKFLNYHGLTQQRACALIGISRNTLFYRSKKVPKDELLIKRLKQIVSENPDYGSQRAHLEYCRRFEHVNHKRIERIWKIGGFSLKSNKKRKRRVGEPKKVSDLSRINQVWSCDFLEDRTSTGDKLRVFTIIDEYSRECLALRVRRSFKSSDVIDIIKDLIARYGTPEFLKSDNGPEFIAKSLRAWIVQAGFSSTFIEPGKPWQNGRNERFNGTLRTECLSKEWFLSLWDAMIALEEYRKYYNERRIHSSLDGQTPLEFAKRINQEQEKDGLSE